MTRSAIDLTGCLALYAERFHRAVGRGHHVASPLGAWLLLALVGPVAQGESRSALTDALGCEVEAAAGVACEMLAQPHPLVAAAAAVWHVAQARNQALSRWLDDLPAAVESGLMPSRPELDAWACRHTLGLIETFPIELDPSVLLLVATALATRVSWEVPFDVVPAAQLGTHSPWSPHLTRVLRASGRDPRQVGFIAGTPRAGDVAVHMARARDGLIVTSVIANPDVPAVDVLAAAQQVAVDTATSGVVLRRSLFELPLGDGPMWTITEQPFATTQHQGREERCAVVMPAWSAESDLNLSHPGLGFAAAAAALAEMLELESIGLAAKQKAMARYTRVGFEAAAVTGLAIAVAGRVPREGLLREALLRFAHPYAVVAVTVDANPMRTHHGPWHGVPVFSAWVVEPDDVPEAEAGSPD